MRPTRTLALKREALSPLASEELASVNGGAQESHLCDTLLCMGSGVCESLQCEMSWDFCPTMPVKPCLSIPTCR